MSAEQNYFDETLVLTEADLDALYEWLDEIPFSRPKKSIARDFSDGVLVAELISYYFPKYVDMQNFYQTSTTVQKKTNWNILNRKALAKIDLQLSDATIQHVVDARSGAIEQVLWDIRRKILALPLKKAGSKKVVKSAIGSNSTSTGCSSSPTDADSDANYLDIGRSSAGSYSRPRGVSLTAPPSQIIFRGNRLVPACLVDEKRNDIQDILEEIEELEKAVTRLTALIEIKEAREEALELSLEQLPVSVVSVSPAGTAPSKSAARDGTPVINGEFENDNEVD